MGYCAGMAGRLPGACAVSPRSGVVPPAHRARWGPGSGDEGHGVLAEQRPGSTAGTHPARPHWRPPSHGLAGCSWTLSLRGSESTTAAAW